jgi:signal transduction histidine kinase
MDDSSASSSPVSLTGQQVGWSLEDSGLPVLLTSLRGEIFDYSQAARDLLAGPEEILEDKMVQDFHTGSYPFELLDQLESLKPGGSRRLEARFRVGTGDILPFRVLARKKTYQNQPYLILTLIEQSATEHYQKEVFRLKEELRLAYLRLDQVSGEQESTAQQSQFEVSLLSQIGQILLTTIDLDKVLFTILTCVTAHPAFGFSRAFLLLVNEETGTLEGKMGVGPRSVEEAYRIWKGLSGANWGLEEFLDQYDRMYAHGELPLDSVIKRYKCSLEPNRDILVDAILSKLPFQVEDAVQDERVSPECLEILACNQFVVVPLVARDQALGVVVADNLYKDRSITPQDVRLLTLFTNASAMALQNAATHTKIRENMKQMQEMQRQLIHAERLSAIGQMTAKVAHEIRNPLVTIGGFARSILREMEPGSRQARKCQIMVEETMRLEEILGTLLDFTRQRQLQLEHCRVGQLVHKAYFLMKDLIEQSGVHFRREIGEGLPTVYVDSGKITQVLINLIKNAIEAMDSAGEITLSAHVQGRFLSLKVTDDGPGIRQDLIGNIFNPFFTTKSDGFGLGLAICRTYVYDHGGNISVQSMPGKGTCFEILLPLPPLADQQSALVDHEEG